MFLRLKALGYALWSYFGPFITTVGAILLLILLFLLLVVVCLVTFHAFCFGLYWLFDPISPAGKDGASIASGILTGTTFIGLFAFAAGYEDMSQDYIKKLEELKAKAPAKDCPKKGGITSVETSGQITPTN